MKKLAAKPSSFVFNSIVGRTNKLKNIALGSSTTALSKQPQQQLGIIPSLSSPSHQKKCFSSSLSLLSTSSKFPSRPVPAVSVTLLKLINNKQGSEVDGFKVLMIRRGKAPGKNLIALPGGHLNLGERLVEGAKRELLEETGINPDLIHFMNTPLYTVESIYYHQEEDDGNELTTHGDVNSSSENDIKTMKISTKSNEINFRKELVEELTRRKREGDDSIQIQYHFTISSVLGIVPPELNQEIQGEPSDDASQIQWIRIDMKRNGDVEEGAAALQVDEEGCITTHISDWIDERNHRRLCEKLQTIYTMPIVVRHAIMRLTSDVSLLYQFNDMMIFYPIRDRILQFWFPQGDAVPQHWWFKSSPKLDETIKTLFESHVVTLSNKLELLFDKSFEEIDAVLRKQSKETLLSAMIMLDQFPRNMYRSSARSFAFDDVAVKLSLWCIENQIDQQFESSLHKIWFYFPLEHAEDLELQEMSCELFAKLVEGNESMSMFNKYAINHREVIKQFGRFPYRNTALGRESTPEEIAYLESQ